MGGAVLYTDADFFAGIVCPGTLGWRSRGMRLATVRAATLTVRR